MSSEQVGLTSLPVDRMGQVPLGKNTGRVPTDSDSVNTMCCHYFFSFGYGDRTIYPTVAMGTMHLQNKDAEPI